MYPENLSTQTWQRLLQPMSKLWLAKMSNFCFFCGREATFADHLFALTRFALVGGASALVDVLLVFVCLRIGAAYPTAVSIGYLISLLFNFLAHKFFTFQQRLWTKGEFVRYLCLAAFNYIFTITLVSIGVEVFKISPMIAKVGSLPIIAVEGYALGRIWVFRPEKRDEY